MVRRIFVTFFFLALFWLIFQTIYVTRMEQKQSKGSVLKAIALQIGNSTEKATDDFWSDVYNFIINLREELKK